MRRPFAPSRRRGASVDAIEALAPLIYLHGDDLPDVVAVNDEWPNRGTDPAKPMLIQGGTPTITTVDGERALTGSEVRWSSTGWETEWGHRGIIAACVVELAGPNPPPQQYLPGSYSHPYWWRLNVTGSNLYRIGSSDLTAAPAPSTSHRRLVSRMQHSTWGTSTHSVDGTRYVNASGAFGFPSVPNGLRYGNPSAKLRALAFFDPTTTDVTDVENAFEEMFG